MVVAMFAAMGALSAVTITTSAKTFQKAGGAASVVIQGDGSWTATSDSSWIVIKSGASGNGAGSCVYVVNANATADVRIGHIDIDGNTYTITQYGYDATISPTSATFDRYGGNGTISVTVDAGVSWSAVANNDWISVSPASGMSVGTVNYTVAEYPGVVSRVGSITIGGKTFTITQTGVDVSISPEKAMMDEGADIVAVTVNALATTQWTVTPNASWISIIDKSSGYGDYVLTLAVNANPSFERRTGTVSIGTATFTISQAGASTAALSIAPATATAAASGAYGNVAVYATPDAPWTAESLSSWLTISEGAFGAGNGNIKYVASANPTLEEREGVIKITPPYKEPELDLNAGLECWMPSFTSVEGNGQRYFLWGDSTDWSEAQQTDLQKAGDTCLNLDTSGCTTDTANTWDGRSSIGLSSSSSYVKTKVAGPGTISFRWRPTMNYLRMLVDNRQVKTSSETYVVWPTIPITIAGSGNHTLEWSGADSYSRGCVDFIEWNSTATSILFDGTAACCLNGKRFPAKAGEDFTASIAFSVNELDRVNRLMTLAGKSIYLDIENRLVFHEKPTDFVVDAADTYYTMLIRQRDDGVLSVYAGRTGFELAKVLETPYAQLLDFSQDISTSIVKLGYTALPTSGYLTQGNMKNFRFWTRAVTDMEAERADTAESVLVDAAPKYAPSGAVWDYFPMDGNMLATKSTSATPALVGNSNSRPYESNNRYGLRQRAIESGADDYMFISDMRSLFGSTEASATYSMWFYIDKLPTSGATSLMRRYWSGKASYASNDGNVEVSVLPSGAIQLNNNGSTTSYATMPALEKQWYMLTLVGTASRTLQVYLDDTEIGNVSSATTLGYYNWSNYGNENNFMHGMFGGGACAIDDLVIYHQALTSAQVRQLYEAGKARVVFHHVTQGVQSAQLDKTEEAAPAEGCTLSVALTLTQSVQWTAQSNDSWIQITGDTAGAGSATVAFTVAANPAVTSRTGSISVAGKTLTVVQAGLAASVSCDDTSFGVESDSGTVWVETEGGGTWTASADVDWIHLFDESGTGTTPVMFVVDDYTTTTASRSGTITIAGQKVIITQQGYELSIDPAVAEVGSNAGAGQFGVSAPIDAVWEAITDCDWITIIGARTGIGDGTIQYTIADNLTGETRTGRIVIAGKAYTITQKTTLPVTTKAIGNGTIVGAGNYNQGTSVTLTATPAAGYVFSHWSGDAVGVTNAVSISVDMPKEITATFIPESAAAKMAEKVASQGGFYTRDQIHALEVGNLVLDVDAASGTARVGVQLMETSDLSDPNSWRPVGMTTGNLDVGSDGTVGLNVPATGNAKFFKVVVPKK